MSTTSERLGKQATAMKKDLEEMSETARAAAQEQLAQVGEKASEVCAEGATKSTVSRAPASNTSASGR